MASYPSGHALAAATTGPGLVLALLPPGPARRRLLAVAVPLAGVTALSRTSLNAHWLSDVVGGFALGTGYALAAPRLVAALRPGAPRRRTGVHAGPADRSGRGSAGWPGHGYSMVRPSSRPRVTASAREETPSLR